MDTDKLRRIVSANIDELLNCQDQKSRALKMIDILDRNYRVVSWYAAIHLSVVDMIAFQERRTIEEVIFAIRAKYIEIFIARINDEAAAAFELLMPYIEME